MNGVTQVGGVVKNKKKQFSPPEKTSHKIFIYKKKIH